MQFIVSSTLESRIVYIFASRRVLRIQLTLVFQPEENVCVRLSRGLFHSSPSSPPHTLQSIVIGQNVGKMFYPLLGVMHCSSAQQITQPSAFSP